MCIFSYTFMCFYEEVTEIVLKSWKSPSKFQNARVIPKMIHWVPILFMWVLDVSRKIVPTFIILLRQFFSCQANDVHVHRVVNQCAVSSEGMRNCFVYFVFNFIQLYFNSISDLVSYLLIKWIFHYDESCNPISVFKNTSFNKLLFKFFGKLAFPVTARIYV